MLKSIKKLYTIPAARYGTQKNHYESHFQFSNRKPSLKSSFPELESHVSNNVKIATCNLNQWVLDFNGNKRRIIESLKIAHNEGCTYRIGPELEIPGYSCEDHFYELDTVKHSWEVLADILDSGFTNQMVCDIGMPMVHRDVLYNCRVVLLNKKILYIRPKKALADDGNYRESRWFTPWKKKQLDPYSLPEFVQQITGQHTAPIGVGIMRFNDTEIAHEICEELWEPNSPHISMGLDGAEIIMNSSGSHFALGRIRSRLNLVRSATIKGGGAYVYSNLIGCDGNRLYFDGCSMIAANGKFLKIGSRFSLNEVEVVTGVVNLDSVREEKIAMKSRCNEAAYSEQEYPRIPIDFYICQTKERPCPPIDENEYVPTLPQVEIGQGPAVYLWDYMRRSGACGYFIPLSGGADSAATALIVHQMAQMIFDAVNGRGKEQEFVLKELRRVLRLPNYFPVSAKELTGKFLYSCYMASENSSDETRKRAKDLAEEIGANHLEVNIDTITKEFTKTVSAVIHKTPKFVAQGGNMIEDLALQNVQARTRMVLSYFITQLLPDLYKIPTFVLVLASGNLDEALRGYMTKYDCSSADINPIGGFSKVDLKLFLKWCYEVKGLKSVAPILKGVPTAELRPTSDGVQKDEDEMGMTYEELSVFGTMRKTCMQGPVAMFKRLVNDWDHMPVDLVSDKVKNFFRYYSINRHKMTTITPSIHGEKYGVDDNRYDLRPFLYNVKWDYQFKMIDEIAKKLKEQKRE